MDHLPVEFFEWLDHLSKCQRCRIQAMTRDMLNDLIAEAYGEADADAATVPIRWQEATS